MSKLTRRGLIKRASIGAGAAGALAAAVTAGAHFAPTSAHASSAPAASISSEPMVVSVSDPGNGMLVVMRGESETTIHNPALVRSLLGL